MITSLLHCSLRLTMNQNIDKNEAFESLARLTGEPVVGEVQYPEGGQVPQRRRQLT
jgi:hypothetical protein